VNIAARSGAADTEPIGLVLIPPKSYLLPFGTDKSEFEGLPAVHPCVTRETPTSPSRFRSGPRIRHCGEPPAPCLGIGSAASRVSNPSFRRPTEHGRTETVDNTTNWKPDPFGAHELRFFSADGKPTLLVMDGAKRSYDKPPTDQAEGPPKADQLESDLTPPTQFIPAQTQPPAPAVPPAPEPTTHPAPPEASQEQAPALVPDPTGVATKHLASVAGPVQPSDESSRHYADDVREREQEAMSRPLKVAYGVVCGVLALSALGVLYVHLHHSDGANSTRAVAPTTTTTSQAAKKASTVVLPSRLSPSAEVAAEDMVTSWSMNNRLGALAVATPTAASTLFGATYVSGLAISRGCSTSFSPIVCTYGPPGGASPTDPIYQIRVSQVAGGWYVSSVRIEN
jgi:hypothetical protein